METILRACVPNSIESSPIFFNRNFVKLDMQMLLNNSILLNFANTCISIGTCLDIHLVIFCGRVEDSTIEDDQLIDHISSRKIDHPILLMVQSGIALPGIHNAVGMKNRLPFQFC